MSREKVITTCHWRRPEYSKACCEYLSKCHGIGDYTVLVHIDGKCDRKVISECEKLKPYVKNLSITTHGSHLGCNGNTKNALESGFALSDYVIHIEDDILVARDGLKFLEWAYQFEDDTRIFTTGIWRHNDGWLPAQGRKWIPGHERIAGICGGFYVWGWATWKSRWLEMSKGWTKGNDHDQSWDTILTTTVRGNRGSLLPFISRANNIGENLGTHRGAAWLEHWADSPGFVDPKTFERV